ncbi:histidine phosphatase family protein [Patescibacteria group bacterium]|nr:histidine phosphatase family protein [Patescibacteria group bacterium]
MMNLKNHYFILRHGQTTWPHTEICYPSDNKESVTLSEDGISQIKLVAESLKKENISLIFCSEYLRVRLTAEIVASALGLKPVIDARLNDTELGDYYGKPKASFYQEFPDPAKRFETKSPMGGESWDEVKVRQISFLKETEQKYDGQNILVVGHGDSLWLLEGLIRQMTNKELLDAIFEKKEFIKKGELRKIN